MIPKFKQIVKEGQILSNIESYIYRANNPAGGLHIVIPEWCYTRPNLILNKFSYSYFLTDTTMFIHYSQIIDSK